MEKITFENRTYYFDKGAVFDESFMKLPKVQADKVLRAHYAAIDYTAMNEEELLAYLKELKTSEFYARCIEAIEYGLGKFMSSPAFYRRTFPILTSCYRAAGTPQKAIDFWMEHKALFAPCLSVPLLTSLAAAYCDVGDYELAKKCAGRAYAMQGGGEGYKNELSLVYRRIQKETGGK